MTPSIRFLSVGDVIVLHALAIDDQGGDSTLRDRGLLESAVATPAQQYAGEFMHADLPAMAAAYAFHICKNHPFVDGNKRAATAAMIAFLSDNGWGFDAHIDEAELAILKLAAGEMDKEAFTGWARRHIHQKPSMELREFFRRLDWDQIISTAGAVTLGDSEVEAQATSYEAKSAIPLIDHLDSEAMKWKSFDEVRYAYFNSMAVLLTSIHRVAEDMGYEW